MKKKNLWILVVLLGLFVLGAGAFLSSQGFTVIEEEVWIPQYTSAECSERPESMSFTSLGEINRKGEFFTCTPQATNRYFPTDVAGVECIYHLDIGDLHNAFDCPVGVDEDAVKDECVRLKPRLSGSVNLQSSLVDTDDVFYVINASRQLYVDPLQIGEASIVARIPSYGLKVQGADGFKYPITSNCALSSLSSDFHVLEAQNEAFVNPLYPVNVATALSPAISSQVVRIDGVAGGRLIYITRPNYYRPVVEAEDGWQYVDLKASEQFDAGIECIPLFFGCDEDAKVIPVEEQTVSDSGLGSVTGYAPVTGDSSQLCRYEIVGNQLVATSDCISTKSCPDDEPFWNANTGECESLQVEPEEEPSDDGFLLFLMIVIASVLLVVIVMLLISQGQKKGKNKK